MLWDLLHLDLKTAFLQGETYDLDRRIIHVQLPTDIGLPPYLVGLCTRSVYGLADAPRRWWNRLDKFLLSLGIQPTRADRCTYVCYEGAFKEPKQTHFSDSEATEPAPVTFYGVGSPQGEAARDESSDTAEEVHKYHLVEERLFSACYQQPRTWKQRKEYKEKKVEDCAWTPVVDENLLKFLESVEHKPGWYPFENGHAQVAYRAKALRTPDPYYDKKKFHLRASIVKRRGVWWLLEMNHDMNKENIQASLEEEAEVLVSVFLPSERTYLATTPQLTLEIVEELLEHFMDPVNGSNAKGELTEVVIPKGMKDEEKCDKDLHTAYRSLLGELTEVVIPKGLKDEDKCDKDLHTAYRSLLGYIAKGPGTVFPRTYRNQAFYVLLPSFFDVAQVFLTSNGVVLVHQDVPAKYLKRYGQLPSLSLNVLHPGRGHQLPSSVTGGTWTTNTTFEHVVREKGSNFIPGGEIPSTIRNTAWELMGQQVPNNYGRLVFGTALPLKENFDPTAESIHGLIAEVSSDESEAPPADPTVESSAEAEVPRASSDEPEVAHPQPEREAGSTQVEEARPFWVEYDEDQEMEVA
eukprot:s568_g15.t1